MYMRNRSHNMRNIDYFKKMKVTITKVFTYFALFLLCLDAKKAKKKSIISSFSGSTDSRLNWRQEDVNQIKTTIDISHHAVSFPPVVFTSIATSKFSNKFGFDLDLSFMDEYSLENVTGKYFPDPALTEKKSFAVFLSDLDGNKTASAANIAKYKINYLVWSKQYPSEEKLLDKYEDLLDSKDYSALAPLSYLDFLSDYLEEKKEVIKPLLGKDYVKVVKA